MKKCLSLLILCGCFSYAFAQSNIKPTNKPYKPPKLITSLGQYHDTLQKLTRDQALALINSPLQIKDEKKGVYTISSYQFIYKKRNISEDETGKKYITPSMTAHTFKTTPLSPIWIDNIKVQLKTGEVLWFTDVIAKDNKGRVMFAPDFKIMIL